MENYAKNVCQSAKGKFVKNQLEPYLSMKGLSIHEKRFVKSDKDIDEEYLGKIISILQIPGVLKIHRLYIYN